jgi:hypothetical protein
MEGMSTGREQQVRDETGAALDAYLDFLASRHPRAKGWRLWGGLASWLVAAAGGATTATAYAHHVRWALVAGIALIGVASGMLGYWLRDLRA